MEVFLLTFLQQIELVKPDGDKLIWVLLVIVLIVTIFFLVQKNGKWKNWLRIKPKAKLKVRIQLNKQVKPATFVLTIDNYTGSSVLIESVVLRFLSIKQQKAFKITSVSGQQVYPLYLEATKNHQMVYALEPFFTREPALQKYQALRLEVNIAQQGKVQSNTVLL